MAKLKTLYRYLRFEKGAWGWLIMHEKTKKILGEIIHWETWNEYVMNARSDQALPYRYLLEISDFIKRLNAQKPKE